MWQHWVSVMETGEDGDGRDGGEERRIMNQTGKGFFLLFFFLDSAARGSGPLGLLTSASLAPEGSEGRKKNRMVGKVLVPGSELLLDSNGKQRISHLGLLCGLDDDAVGGVVQLPRNNAQELRLVLVAVVVRRADTYELRGKSLASTTAWMKPEHLPPTYLLKLPTVRHR